LTSRSAASPSLLSSTATATTYRSAHRPLPSPILHFFSRAPLSRVLSIPLSYGLSRLSSSPDFFDQRSGLLSCLSAGFQAFESNLRRVRHGRPHPSAHLPSLCSPTPPSSSPLTSSAVRTSVADSLLPYYQLSRAFSHLSRALSRRRRLLSSIAIRFPYALPPVYFKRHLLRLVADGTKTCDARISSDPFYHSTPGSYVLASCRDLRFPITVLRTRTGFTSVASAWAQFGPALFPSAGSAKTARAEFGSLYRSRSRSSFRHRPITVHTIGLLPSGTSCPLPLFHPYRLAFRAWLTALSLRGDKGGGGLNNMCSRRRCTISCTYGVSTFSRLFSRPTCLLPP